MSNYIFRLYQDTLPAANAPVYLGAGPRSLYIVEGDITIETPTAGQNHPSGSAWVGQDAISLVAGAQGAKVWRWELLALNDKSAGELRSAPGSVSTRKLVTEIELADGFEWLMRIDRVGFPKGGIAYTHVHQGPGIRCCLHGEITIDTEGTSHVYQARRILAGSRSVAGVCPDDRENRNGIYSLPAVTACLQGAQFGSLRAARRCRQAEAPDVSCVRRDLYQTARLKAALAGPRKLGNV